MPTINDLRQQAATIKNATQVGENTATRVGTTFETIADLLEGASVGQGVPSVDLSQLNALRTPADQTTANPTIYNVTTLHNLSSTTIKVGTLFIFSDAGRAVVTQILLSNYQVDGGGNISSPNTSQITMYYRMFNIVQETWSAWTLYAGGGGGGTIDPYPVSGSDNAVASNGVFEGLQKAAPEVNINDLDDLGDFVDMRTGKSSAYTLKYMHTQSSTWLRVGVVMCFANQAQNTLTQIVFSNCVVDGGGNLIPNSATNVMNVFYRFKQFSGNPPEGMTIGVWTTWAKFGDSGYQPDDEDIDLNASDQLQFANKSYDASAFSGLGRVYLRKNIVELNLTDKYFDGFVSDVLVQEVGTSSTPDEICFDTTRKMFVARVGLMWYLDWSSDEDYNPITRDVNWNYNGNFYRWNGEELAQWDKTINQLTQAMVNTANTIYHIQYDYDLNGQTITLPAGCVLEFDGGSITNGTIIGTGTKISADVYTILDDVVIGGSFKVDNVYPQWFDAKGDGVTDDTDAIQKAFNFGANVLIPAGTYMLNGVDITNKEGINIRGISDVVLKRLSVSGVPLINVDDCKNIEILNLSIDGNSETLGGSEQDSNHNISIRGGENITLQDISSTYSVCDGMYIARRNESVPINITLKNVSCKYNFRQGMSVVYVKGISCYNCDFSYTGKSAAGGTSPNAGVDLEANSADYPLLDVTFVGCRFVGNTSSGLVASDYATNLIVRDCYFSSNERSGLNSALGMNIFENITIEDNNIIAENSARAAITLGQGINILNNIKINNCGGDGIDVIARCIANNVDINKCGRVGVLFTSSADAVFKKLNITDCYNLRSVSTYGFLKIEAPAYCLLEDVGITWNADADVSVVDLPFNVNSGSHNAYLRNVRINGTFTGGSTLKNNIRRMVAYDTYLNGEFLSMAPPTVAGGIKKERLANAFIMTAGSAAPTNGTWSIGDKVFNTAPSTGGYVGWVCVAAGTPGTWKGFGLIE